MRLSAASGLRCPLFALLQDDDLHAKPWRWPLKIAWQWWRNQGKALGDQLIAFEGAYHR